MVGLQGERKNPSSMERSNEKRIKAGLLFEDHLCDPGRLIAGNGIPAKGSHIVTRTCLARTRF